MIGLPSPLSQLPAKLLEWLVQSAWGFLYWLAFLLVLEPGNILRAARAGVDLNPATEALRICVAAGLGAAATPAMIGLARRFPINVAARRWRNLGVHLLATPVIAAVLIFVSCVLATWMWRSAWLPTPGYVVSNLIANGTLLVFALGALTLLAHLRLRPEARPQGIAAPIVVKDRGRQMRIALADIDWIETQGNYLALHVGGHTHLIRESISVFLERPGAERFLRIHRRTLIGRECIHAFLPATNGDGIVTLKNGRELKLSRSYRQAFHAVWPR